MEKTKLTELIKKGTYCGNILFSDIDGVEYNGKWRLEGDSVEILILEFNLFGHKVKSIDLLTKSNKVNNFRINNIIEVMNKSTLLGKISLEYSVLNELKIVDVDGTDEDWGKFITISLNMKGDKQWMVN